MDQRVSFFRVEGAQRRAQAARAAPSPRSSLQSADACRAQAGRGGRAPGRRPHSGGAAAAPVTIKAWKDSNMPPRQRAAAAVAGDDSLAIDGAREFAFSERTSATGASRLRLCG